MRFAPDSPALGTWGRIFFVACAFIALAAPPVAAQGRGNKNGHRVNSSPATTGSAAPLAATAGGPSTLQFGSWLDDASVLAPGGAWTSVSFGYFRLTDSSQTDFPVVDAGIGLTNRVQFGVTVPYYRIQVPQTAAFGGLGDVYVNAKVSLMNPADTTRRFGVALTPVVEILEQPTVAGDKVAWGIPVNLEFRPAGYRVFGSTGFFSRGSFFAGGAMEASVNDRLVLTGALTFTRSLKADPAAEAFGITRNRSDLTGALSYFVTPSIATFVGTGRTLSSNPAATSFMLNAGVSMSFTPRVTP
jgi:hypothetical protein